ncbi:MAG TPA: ATP-binding cassette domain-containing protein [Thermoanaerobaculia bacterium]|nr:ATP-binding cassette domain-containing protein [Thermoanaerobaculia bacterium]
MRLVAEKLCRSFGPRKVFGPLSFATAPGKVLGVAGANGSGKTTLVKTLVGLIRPSSGSVWLEDEARPGVRIAVREAQTSIGWCAPDLALYGELTPAENLEFFARVGGRPIPREDAEHRIAEVGLDPKRLRTIHTRFLSTGQRQRLKLAYSVLGSPAVLFLDEPGSNLDEAGHKAVEAIVAAQRARGSVVLATNDPVELALADERVTL